jgi:NAD(P)-dependent dehydrogenase (short-subunit alcohol dehydrogenase family)
MNKNIIITGALGLLGKPLTLELAEKGNNVIMLDIKSKDELKRYKNFSLVKDRLNYIKCDVSNIKNVKKVDNFLKKKFQKIDILINAAAITDAVEGKKDPTKSMFENYTIKNWNKSILGNLNSMFICSQVFGKRMIKYKKGSIINISSTYGIVGPDQSIYKNKKNKNLFFKSPSYPTSKGAVISFTKYLAAYWGDKGILVNCVSPGGIKNNQNKEFIKRYSEKTILGKMAETKDIIGIIKFLCTEESSYITGSNIVVDGGWTAI